jgi:hypothetical protein
MSKSVFGGFEVLGGVAKLAAVLGLAASGLIGCHASGASCPEARMPVRGEHAVVEVQGQGRVLGGEIACAADGGRCEATFDDLWATPLAAEASPGWRFAGWTRRSSGASLGGIAPSQPTIVYTARFEAVAAESDGRDLAAR